MKYFFADSQDLVDPNFDFTMEDWGRERIRQRLEAYGHEVFKTPAYDGLLISKGIVSGIGGGSRFSLAQRHRLRRLGAREFYRLHNVWGQRMPIMGDCGAFTYVREEIPPFSVDDVIDFYLESGVDLGISVDHVILAYNPTWDRPGRTGVPAEIRRRQEITLELARKFLARHRGEKLPFEPVGVAQGWSPDSYAFAVRSLQEMGYCYVALGGMVALKTQDILACLEAIATVRIPNTQLHLLGVTRVAHVVDFSRYGVASFDSTSPLRQAFKDDRDNYWTLDGAYTAIRVPQVEGNPKLSRQVRAGQIAQHKARVLERRCLEALRQYDAGLEQVPAVLAALADYEALYGAGQTARVAEYRATLEDQPWKRCPCEVCHQIGYHVILFRGAERNRRRGFHNLWTFYRQLQRGLGQTTSQTAVTGGNPKQKRQLPLFG